MLSKGQVIWIIGEWTFTLFLIGADRELSCNPFLEQTNDDDRCSLHDPPCMGNVHSIETNPRSASCIVFRGDRFYSCRRCHLPRFEVHVGCVDVALNFCICCTDPLLVQTVQILDFSYCVWQNNLPNLTKVVSILQMTHAVAMCILAIAQFVRQSLQMRRVTRGWQLNRYMNLLVQQGILYFSGYVPLPLSFSTSSAPTRACTRAHTHT